MAEGNQHPSAIRKVKLQHQVREDILIKHHSRRTEQAYVLWVWWLSSVSHEKQNRPPRPQKYTAFLNQNFISQ